MRIVHTSDWHLGRMFAGKEMRDDQEQFCNWIVEAAIGEQADLVIVAGDIYDRAVAPRWAIRLFGETIRRLSDGGAKVAAIAGNHDSGDRIAPYAGIGDGSGIYLRGGYGQAGEVITAEFDDGPLNLVLVPFLNPIESPPAPPDGNVVAADGQDPDSDSPARQQAGTGGDADAADGLNRHGAVLADALRCARPQIASPRTVAVAHAFVIGGKPSESERTLSVGGADQVPASLFDGFSYTALGHLHRPQLAADGPRPVRYSGSPLAYSFSEEHPKTVTVIDMAADGTATATEIPIPVGRPVKTIRGTIDELTGPARPKVPDGAWVRAVLTDRGTVADAKARLAVEYPGVVAISCEPEGTADGPAPAETARLSPVAAARAFWADTEGADPEDEEDALLAAAIEAATADPAEEDDR